jgi:hypothetical protein
MSEMHQGSWTKLVAMAIPKGDYLGKPEQGRYGPIFPKTPACYGLFAKLIPGGEEACYKHARTIEEAAHASKTPFGSSARN